jgi:CBS domain-containing protein
MPMSARIVSKGAGYLPSPVADHAPGPAACVFKIHREVPRRLRHPGGRWLGGGAQVRIRRLACSIAARTYIRSPVKVTVSKKSAARMASACERRSAAQLSVLRSDAGSMSASVRTSQSVDAAALTPRTSSSPWMRHAGRERDHQSLRYPPVARTLYQALMSRSTLTRCVAGGSGTDAYAGRGPRRIVAERVGALGVYAGDRLIGIISEYDLVCALADGGTRMACRSMPMPPGVCTPPSPTRTPPRWRAACSIWRSAACRWSAAGR